MQINSGLLKFSLHIVHFISTESISLHKKTRLQLITSFFVLYNTGTCRVSRVESIVFFVVGKHKHVVERAVS